MFVDIEFVAESDTLPRDQREHLYSAECFMWIPEEQKMPMFHGIPLLSRFFSSKSACVVERTTYSRGVSDPESRLALLHLQKSSSLS